MMAAALEKTDEDREKTNILILELKDEGMVSSELYQDGLRLLLDNMAELEKEVGVGLPSAADSSKALL